MHDSLPGPERPPRCCFEVATLPGLAIQHLTLKPRHFITNNGAGDFDPVVIQTLSSNKVFVKSIYDMTAWVQEIDSSKGRLRSKYNRQST